MSHGAADNILKFSNNGGLLNSINFSFRYRGEIGRDNGFKLYVIIKGDNDTLPLFIISAIGTVNPRSKAKEIYDTLVNVSQNLQLDMNRVRVILDLLEITGIDKTHLYDWEFVQSYNNIQDKIQEIKEMSPGINDVIGLYYNERFSTLTNSALNNKQKVDIAAHALAEKCYDEFSAENIVRQFKESLKRAVKKKSPLRKALSKFL